MAAEHFDGDGDGVELIVMLCVGERTDLLEKSVDPRAADEDNLALLGEVRPTESTSEFVGVNTNSTKATTKETVFAAKLLKKCLTMKSLFDAVFGRRLIFYLLDNKPPLFGELKTRPENI